MCSCGLTWGWPDIRARCRSSIGSPASRCGPVTTFGARSGGGAIPVIALTEDHRRWIDGALAAESEEQFRRQIRAREAAELLDWALGRLPAEDRLVVTLVHLEGRSIREAAELLGWSVGNVKVRAYRARKALRKTLAGLF